MNTVIIILLFLGNTIVIGVLLYAFFVWYRKPKNNETARKQRGIGPSI